ncbi:MAG: ABC transporter substrate-binding protein [Chloroflexi bacterium]|nr:ABC transporter substrate-binding protein [Chloroflexota bacterium]
MKRNSILSIMLLLVILSGLLVGCSQEKTIKIGFVAQVTGPDSYVGQYAKLALEDRVAEINEAGGIEGYKIELITYDTRSEIPDAVAATKRLIEQDKVVAVIGPEWSGAAIPIAEIADASQVPVIATTASNIKVTVDDNGNVHPFMFRTCFIDPYQGYALADFAYKELGKTKVAFITDVTSAYSVGIQQFFEDHFTELGGTVVAKEGYQANDTEFRAQISKVAESGADLLIVPTGTYRDIALIAQQAAALNLDIQYLGVDGWVADELLTMAGKELEGAYLSSGVSSEMPEFKEYNAAFEAKHNQKVNIYAYYALDALYMIENGVKESLKANGEVTPVGVRDAIENMKDVQLFTSKVTMEPDTHNPHNKPILIMQIADSKWNLIKTYEP